MADNGNATLGHRFLVLSGILSRVGFGICSANEGFGATAMHINMAKQNDGIVVNDDKPENWDIISWPTPGYFPAGTSLFDNNVDQKRWSIRFNQNKYDISTVTKVVVTRTGSVNETYEFTTPNNADFRKIGGDTYIFYKAGATYKDGDLVKVQIQNVTDKKNNNAKINLEYGVEFFDLTKIQ